jgi:hypothetical protein
VGGWEEGRNVNLSKNISEKKNRIKRVSTDKNTKNLPDFKYPPN